MYKNIMKDLQVLFYLVITLFVWYVISIPNPMVDKVQPTLSWEVGHMFYILFGTVPACIPVYLCIIISFANQSTSERRERRLTMKKRLQIQEENLQSLSSEACRLRRTNEQQLQKLIKYRVLLDKIAEEKPEYKETIRRIAL